MPRTKRELPEVRAILKQTPSPVRGLSLGLWESEQDWTVLLCGKHSKALLLLFHRLPDASDWTKSMKGRDREKNTRKNIHCCLRASCSASSKVQIFVSRRESSSPVEVLHGRRWDFHWSNNSSSKYLRAKAAHKQKCKIIRYKSESKQRVQLFISFELIMGKDGGYWITLFSKSTMRRNQINTSVTYFSPLWAPRWRTLPRCNVVGKIEWTTLPGRLIISRILSACSMWWALTEGLTGENDVLFSAGITVQVPHKRLLLRYEVYKKTTRVFFFLHLWSPQGTRNSETRGDEWQRMLRLRDPWVLCVHASALHVNSYTRKKKTHF